MGFFSRRRRRESAIPGSAGAEAPGSFASPEGQPVVGQQIGGGQPEVDVQGLSGMDGLQALMRLGPMIQQAIASGNVQVSHGDPQVLDMRGTGLREEILQIMAADGIDPDSATAANVDASAYGDMQKQILEALSKHGIDAGASGSSLNFQIAPEDDSAK